MANNFPVLPDMPQVMSLQYGIEVTQTGGRGNNTVPGTMDLMFYGFVTGQDEAGAYVFDYSQGGTFDQDAHEAQMVTLLNGLCATWAAALGVDLAVVQAAVKVRRTWQMTTPAALPDGSWPDFFIIDHMTYP